MITVHRLFHNKLRSWVTSEQWDAQNFRNGEVLVESVCSLISKGTEKRVITSSMDPETAEKMKIPHMQGDFTESFTYGYSLVGEVIRGPEDVMGKIVHLLHPHQSHALVDVSDLSFVPHGMTPEIASLASNMETAVNAFWDSDLIPGDKVLIQGLGMIGTLVAMVIMDLHKGIVEVTDPKPESKILAEKLGLKESNGLKDQYDVIINCSANPAAIGQGFKMLKHEGRLVEVSWYGSEPVQVSLGDDFHYKRLRITSSQVSHIPGKMAAQWDFKSRKTLVFDLLQKLVPGWLIDKEIEFSEAPEYFAKLRNGNINSVGTLIRY